MNQNSVLKIIIINEDIPMIYILLFKIHDSKFTVFLSHFPIDLNDVKIDTNINLFEKAKNIIVIHIVLDCVIICLSDR